MADLVVELLALLIYGPLVVLVHEAGHAAFARMGGYRVTSFGVGLGRPLWSVYLSGGVVFHVDRWLIAGGACTAIPTGPLGARRAWFHAGGLIVQAVLAAFLLLLPDHWLVARVLQFNLLVAATNAIPWRWGGQASDGWYVLDAFTGSRTGGGILRQRALFRRMAAREAAVGSPLGRVYSETCAAWADVIAGRPAEASPLFKSDPAEVAMDPWVDALYHYVCAEWHRVGGRPLAAVRVAREARAALHRPVADEAVGLLSLAEARALIDIGAPERAQRTLARVASIGGTIGRQSAITLLWASLDDEDAEQLELATWRVERRRAEAWLDPADAVLALCSAARRLEEHGRIAASLGARETAAELAKQMLSRASAVDAESLSRRLGDALASARRDAVAAD